MSLLYNLCQVTRDRLIRVITMLLVMSHGSIALADFPSPGFTPSGGKWVNIDLVTWSKPRLFKEAVDQPETYEQANKLCKEMASSTGQPWKLPTSKQVHSFYINSVSSPIQKPRLLKLGWPFDTVIWTSTVGTVGHQFVSLQSGKVSWHGNPGSGASTDKKGWACVMEPDEFDGSGNYFDGKRIWTKITEHNNPAPPSIDSSMSCPSIKGSFAYQGLPKEDQLNAFLTHLKADSDFRNKLEKHGWKTKTIFEKNAVPVMPHYACTNQICGTFIGWAGMGSNNTDNEKWYLTCIKEPKFPS